MIDDIERYLQTLLDVKSFQDYCYNGIQVEGKKDPKLLAVGVSLSMEFLKEAVKRGADAVLVHHGFFGKDFVHLRGFFKERIAYVLTHQLTVFGFHLPLDAHPEYGNNALIAKRLGLSLEKRIDVGYVAVSERKLAWEDFEKRLRGVFPASRFCIYQNSEWVQRIGVISGGAAFHLRAFEGEIDTFLCGETKEQTLHEAKEMGVNFINAGHYYTEVFGVQALAELIEKEFGLPWMFIDVPNEV